MYVLQNSFKMSDLQKDVSVYLYSMSFSNIRKHVEGKEMSGSG